ncbi:response regulator [Thaumasiovibrio subtropicus]|uniref:response regulator n=1 Tax=Thaumasiovibrio subtropicus TaxID=1891207 RepID=UPI000B3581F7|nr:response regulator [Thaumasiovibrio subtropicus]
MHQILVVEDETKISQLLADYLKNAGYGVTQLYDGSNVLKTVKTTPPSLVLLDLMLPVVDGLTLCREIRQHSDVPIIMITAKIEEIDRLLGLELGADDYICKPFSPREVVARVKAVLKRYHPPKSSDELVESAPPTPLQLNPDKLEATLHGTALTLTAIEFNLLHLLASDPGRVYSRSQLIDNIYRDHRVVSERTIDSHIKKLRKKLNQIHTDDELVQSVYSVGYKYCP